MKYKGLLISFEGIDYSGKSTQIKKLTGYCKKRNIPFILMREPGGTAIGERIRDILLDKKASAMSAEAELLLYSAARAQLVREIIVPSLKDGKVVILDRFYDSTTAYQGYGRGLDLEKIREITAFAIGESVPDITFYIKIDAETMKKRKRSAGMEEDRMEANKEEFFLRVLNGYEKIAEMEPQRIFVVDGQKDETPVFNEIIRKLQKDFPRFKTEEV